MSVEATVELLSRYLDGDLADRERKEVEDLLERSEQARRRLAELRNVVGHLQGLEAIAPPVELEARVRTLAEHAGGRVRVLGRFNSRVRKMILGPSLAPGFAIVLSLAAMLYLFSSGVARVGERGTSIIMPGHAPGFSQVRSIDGRTFARDGGVWVEEGVDVSGGTPVDLELSGGDLEAWLVENPGLESVTELGGDVILSWQGQVTRLRMPVE